MKNLFTNVTLYEKIQISEIKIKNVVFVQILCGEGGASRVARRVDASRAQRPQQQQQRQQHHDYDPPPRNIISNIFTSATLKEFVFFKLAIKHFGFVNMVCACVCVCVNVAASLSIANTKLSCLQSNLLVRFYLQFKQHIF